MLKDRCWVEERSKNLLLVLDVEWKKFYKFLGMKDNRYRRKRLKDRRMNSFSILDRKNFRNFWVWKISAKKIEKSKDRLILDVEWNKFWKFFDMKGNRYRRKRSKNRRIDSFSILSGRNFGNFWIWKVTDIVEKDRKIFHSFSMLSERNFRNFMKNIGEKDRRIDSFSILSVKNFGNFWIQREHEIIHIHRRVKISIFLKSERQRADMNGNSRVSRKQPTSPSMDSAIIGRWAVSRCEKRRFEVI